MITLLVISVLFAFIGSMICSLTEAAIYSVPISYAKKLEEQGFRAGKLLVEFKDDIAKPISVILIFNTLSNVMGASFAGSAAGMLFDQIGLGVFTALFTLAILYCGEILPKIVGARYCRPVARAAAVPVHILSKALAPFIWVATVISNSFLPEDLEPTVSHEEVLSLAAIGEEEGALDRLEGEVISNVIGLDQLLVKDILTPRVSVVRFEENTKLSEVRSEIQEWKFSRIPLFAANDPDHLNCYVMLRDIYRELLNGNDEMPLKSIARRLGTVPSVMSADKLLLHMFEKKEHICSVVDEYGNLSGIITLEDILEEVVGYEIVDEYDTVSDQRSLTKRLKVPIRGDTSTGQIGNQGSKTVKE